LLDRLVEQNALEKFVQQEDIRRPLFYSNGDSATPEILKMLLDTVTEKNILSDIA